MHTIRIFFKLCELNLKKLFIYRISFVISLALMTIWVLADTLLIEVIFYHTNTLAGWDKGQVLLIMSFYYYVQNLSDMFFKDNFEEFGEKVRRGLLDFDIVKPVPTGLLAFFREMRFDHAAGLVITSGLFGYALHTLNKPLIFTDVLFGFGLILVSLVLYFAFLSCIASLTFFIQRTDTFYALIFNISQVSRYPRQIYTSIVGKILTFGLPLALIASIPAEVALHVQETGLVLFFV